MRGLWWEMPVEESRQPRKPGDTAESCVGGGAITIASLLTGQHVEMGRRFKREWIDVYLLGFPGGSEVKASAWNAGDKGSIPGFGKIPWRRKCNALQYSCLENPMDGGAW